MSQNENTQDLADMDALLDATLDDLADLPEFVVPPAGAYNVTIKEAGPKKIAEKPAIEFQLRFDQTVELNDSAETPVKDGAENNVAYFLDNEFSQGALKKLLGELSSITGEGTLRERLANLKGAQVLMVTTVRKGKKGTENADKTFLGIKSATPL